MSTFVLYCIDYVLMFLSANKGSCCVLYIVLHYIHANKIINILVLVHGNGMAYK